MASDLLETTPPVGFPAGETGMDRFDDGVEFGVRFRVEGREKIYEDGGKAALEHLIAKHATPAEPVAGITGYLGTGETLRFEDAARTPEELRRSGHRIPIASANHRDQ